MNLLELQHINADNYYIRYLLFKEVFNFVLFLRLHHYFKK